MSAKSTPAAPPAAEPVPPEPPATEYERFLDALPESFREECRNKLKGSGLNANHPIFNALAELYEIEGKKPARNFIQEVTAHANLAKQLLEDLKRLPDSILGKIEPQLLGLVAMLNAPLQKLENVSEVLQSLTQTRPPPLPAPSPGQTEGPELKTELRRPKRDILSTVSNPLAWIMTGSICLTLSVAVVLVTLTLGAAHLSHSYEASYRDRVAHMEADSAANTVALTRLLANRLTLKVERSKDDNAVYLILQGARKAAQPVNSPEGLAVEVWPENL